MLPVKNHILHVLSDSTAETQIMAPVKQTLEEIQETDVFNQLDMYRFKGTKAQAIEAVLCGTQGIETLRQPRPGD